MSAGRRSAPRVEYELAVRAPRFESSVVAQTLGGAMVGAGAVAGAIALTAVVAIPMPAMLHRPAAALLLIVLSVVLTNRVGGHMRIWAVVATVVAVLAATLQTAALLASAAGMTAVVAAVLAVMMTCPADTASDVLREVAVAIGVALVGMIGVAAWNAHVNPQRFAVVVLAASLGLAISLVWNLGAGLHGLSRVHVSIIAATAAVVVLVIAYSALVRAYGTQSLVQGVEDMVLWSRRTVGGVPHPLELLAGFPTLVAGVAIRSRQREGWWVQVFSVIGTALIAAALVSPAAYPSYVLLSLLYSVVPGVALGFLARHFLVGAPSQRSSRAIERPVRSEPGRFAGLK